DNFISNNLMVHFMHRGIAYLILILTLFFYFKARKQKGHRKFQLFNTLFLIVVLMQVILGIVTVLHGDDPEALVWYGVAHQFVAMLLVICLVCLWYLSTRKKY